MRKLKDEIIINRAVEDVFRAALEVEKYSEFIPGYKENILSRDDKGEMTVKRTAEVGGKIMTWKSKFSYDEAGKSLYFEQIEGRLKGMKIFWNLKAEGQDKTRLEIIHVIDLKIPVIGGLVEKFAVAPKVNALTRTVLESFKRKMEGVL